jgi:two-component system response regulator AtoC
MVIDDERDFLQTVKRGLLTADMTNIVLESDPLKAAEYFKNGSAADIAIIDITMPGLSGTELLDIIKEYSPATECIMATAVNDAQTAISCMKKGAYDYLVKPLNRDELILTIHRAAERKQLREIADLGKRTSIPRLENPDAFSRFTTCSPALLRLLKEAELHAASTVPVLITGETGTGKELLARAIHRASARSAQPFTPVNMASITASLFDAEFFGHTRGAFTGAEKERAGYLEHANSGTLFLDEIGTLSAELQGKLLRVLQEQEYYKIGSSTPRSSDIRFIAATNANLERLIKEGGFRKDLYYRLKGAWLNISPLRERKDDIAVLAKAFVKEASASGPAPALTDEALEMLYAYDYPGNIRELQSIIRAAANLAGSGTITPACLPAAVQNQKPRRSARSAAADDTILPLAEVEKNHILRAYAYTDNNKTRTAEVLGIGLNTLRRKLKSYGIE